MITIAQHHSTGQLEIVSVIETSGCHSEPSLDYMVYAPKKIHDQVLVSTERHVVECCHKQNNSIIKYTHLSVLNCTTVFWESVSIYCFTSWWKINSLWEHSGLELLFWDLLCLHYIDCCLDSGVMWDAHILSPITIAFEIWITH